jgi:hypothetical protein
MASVPERSALAAQRNKITLQIDRVKRKLQEKGLSTRTFESLLAKFDKLTSRLNALTAEHARREKRK